jgi:hypothetical protein
VPLPPIRSKSERLPSNPSLLSGNLARLSIERRDATAETTLTTHFLTGLSRPTRLEYECGTAKLITPAYEEKNPSILCHSRSSRTAMEGGNLSKRYAAGP